MVAVKIKVGDGLRVDAVNEMIIPAKGATILARVIKSECFYESKFLSKDMLAVNDGDFNLELPNIDDKILRENFRRESDKAAEGLVMSTAEFKQMVKGSAYVPSDSNSAQLSSLAYSTVNLKFVDGKLTMTGLARPRIAVIGREVDTVKGNFSCNVPAPALRFMAKLAEQGSDICLGYDDATKELHFSVNEWRVVSKCFTVNYPDVSKILRINSSVVAEVNRRELYNAVKFCKPAVDAHKTVKLIFERGKMVQVCSKSENGSKAARYFRAESIFGVELGNAEIRLDIKFLLETISSLSAGAIKIGISEKGAAIFSAVEGAFAFIAPMKDSVKFPTPKALSAPNPVEMSIAVEDKVTVA